MNSPGGNLLVIQGGGPTPVVNATLFGVIDEARRQGFAGIFGARFGVEGLIKGDLIDLARISEPELTRLKMSPGASLGSTRHKLTDENLSLLALRLRAHDIRALLIIGGNGSLRGAEMIAKFVRDVCVIGIPKTIDNDIPGTDRCPGFASAARYAAQAVRDLGMDVRTLPQPVSIFETMGRSAGWLSGATILAKIDESHAPHLIYLPERPFEVDRFLGEVDRTVKKRGWAVAVVTEGLKDTAGNLVYELAAASQRDALNRALPGGVAAHLAGIVTQKLKIRCRWEQPGICGRNSMLHVSKQDLADAELVGRAGVRAAIENRHAHMVSLRPLGSEGDGYEFVPLSECAGGERLVPGKWLEKSDLSVAQPFVDYVRPLVGDLVEYAIPLKDQS